MKTIRIFESKPIHFNFGDCKWQGQYIYFATSQVGKYSATTYHDFKEFNSKLFLPHVTDTYQAFIWSVIIPCAQITQNSSDDNL